LEHFILGMVMVQAIFPLIDGITAVILAGLEALKGYFGMKVSEYNMKIRKMATQDDAPEMRPIGFTFEEEDEPNE
jgi:hypothetical protein